MYLIDPNGLANYNTGIEVGRLHRGLGLIEFARTKEILLEELPPAPAVIYDVGGAYGEYAFFLAEKGYEVLTLVLRGDDGILHARYLHRISHENRHPVHVSTGLDLFEDFEEYMGKLRAEYIPGKTLEINANDFSYQSDSSLLAETDAFMLG